MKPFVGLFAHWDVIARQEPPGFLENVPEDFTENNDGVPVLYIL